MVQHYLEDIVLLDDPTILAGMRFAARAAEAGPRAGRRGRPGRRAVRPDPDRDGERVAVVLSGGNVEVSRLGELVAAAGVLPGATA